MSSTGARSSDELQWFDIEIGYQDSSPTNAHQADIPYTDGQMYTTLKNIQPRQ